MNDYYFEGFLFLYNFHSRIVCVSRDSVVVHEQFERQLRSHGGVHGISFPLLEDLSADISRYKIEQN